MNNILFFKKLNQINKELMADFSQFIPVLQWFRADLIKKSAKLVIIQCAYLLD